MMSKQTNHGGILLMCMTAGTMLLATGCQQPANRVTIETFSQPLTPEKYGTDFTEAYYAETARGGLDIVLRWKQPSKIDPSQDMEQIVHIATFWKPKYGTTHAESTMINARLRFAILTPPTGALYEGGGFLTFKPSWDKKALIAYLESGDLAPTRTVGGAKEPFGPARIQGTLRIVHDEGAAMRLLHAAERKLGL